MGLSVEFLNYFPTAPEISFETVCLLVSVKDHKQSSSIATSIKLIVTICRNVSK